MTSPETCQPENNVSWQTVSVCLPWIPLHITHRIIVNRPRPPSGWRFIVAKHVRLAPGRPIVNESPPVAYAILCDDITTHHHDSPILLHRPPQRRRRRRRLQPNGASRSNGRIHESQPPPTPLRPGHRCKTQPAHTRRIDRWADRPTDRWPDGWRRRCVNAAVAAAGPCYRTHAIRPLWPTVWLTFACLVWGFFGSISHYAGES